MSAQLPQSTRKFHFIREIAAGGFGSVYLAKIIHADGFSRLAAIKLLHPKWSEHEEIVKRMRDEARLLGWLRHRNIVDVLDLTMIDGRCAVIMEYLEAVDLKLVIKSAKLREERIPMRVSLEIAAAVASALDAAYNRPPYAGEKPLRVIHRDIKPSNVMIDDSGTPKVLDFGVARADFDSRESHTQELSFGSLDYMPPERLFFEPETAASDIYSLGATLFELIALERLGKGKLSRDAQDEHVATRLALVDKVFADVPAEIREELADLLFEMLSFEPTERPSAAATVDRLRTLARKRTDEPALAEWAETQVPPLVRAFHQARPSATPDPLIDTTLGEDSRPFGRYATEEAPEPEPRAELPSEEASDEQLEEAVRLPDDDARWQKLKEATLAEISEEVSHRATQTYEIEPTPAGGLGAPLTFEIDADESPTMAFGDIEAFTEWEEDEKPTVAMTLEDVRMASLLESQVPEEWGNASEEFEDDARGAGKKPGAPLPPSLPDSLRGRSAEVYTAPFARPQKKKPAATPPPPPPVRKSATPRPAPAAQGQPDALPKGTPIPIDEIQRARTAENRTLAAEPAPKRSLVGMLATVVVGGGVVLVFGLVGLALGVAGIRSMKGPPAAAALTAPIDARAAEPAPEPPPVDDGPLADGEARFTVAIDDTKKLQVTCDGESASGVQSVRLSAAEGADCHVKWIGNDRSRKTARVAAGPGEWVCFADGSETCVDPNAPVEEVAPTEDGAAGTEGE